MLSFSRKRMLEPEVLNLSETIANVEAMLRRLIGEDIELVTALEPELARIRADRTEITQVLLNLAVNARDAMPGGGTLLFETRNLELDGASVRSHPSLFPGPYVLLTVTDTGIGMDAETQEHLFEPFFTTKDVGKGTGLGLATVYGIVSQSAGWIQVDSTPGEGTTFRIYLPAVSSERPAREVEKTACPSLQGSETILVVEDEPQIRRITALMLRDLGYQVLEASHGAEALRLAVAYAHPIDLVLTDVVMPGMRGPEFAARLQAIRPTPVIFMSGYPESMDDSGGDGAGYLQKPFTTEALARKIRIVLRPGVSPLS
jgi:two-component system, cell cycle sensor histidine kinase and response regulator CckA